MIDAITICGIIIGAILIIIGKKRSNFKLLSIFGILFIIISLVIGAPDIIEGFREGWNSGSNS